MNRVDTQRRSGLKKRALALVGILALASGCDEAIQPPSLLEGDWGGDHVAVEATGDAVATRFDCAHGSIEAPVALDRGGRFSAPGEYVVDAGPSRPLDATYEGTVRGDRLDLRVLIETVPFEPPDTAGPFVAFRGGEARVTYCR